MRVKQVSTQTATKAPRRSSSLHQHSQYMEASFRTTNRAHDSSPEDATVKMRDGGESYSSLVRHNSAVFEHDVNTNRSSLVRTVSEVREEIMQLGCNHTADGNKKKDGYGSDGKPEGKLVRQVSHEVSHESYTLPTPSSKKGQLDSFVLKNYSLQDRRTLSLPVGFVGRSTESQQTRSNDTDKTASSSRNVSYSSKVVESSSTSTSTTASSSSSSSSTSEFCIYDFDMEVERHSKSTLFFQAGTTLFTILATLFTLYLCIRFLTSAAVTSNRHVVDVASMYRNGFRVLQEDDPGCHSQCRFFVKACPLLGLFAAGLAVVAGAWATDGRMWRRAHETMSCTHCEDYEDKRSRAEEADEKVQRAHRSKQQFMAYVFHNIRVPFNAIVLGLGHIRATADGTSSVGTVADKMDLVQMMLDCAETMTSVLDDVTDMGQWEVGQMELHRDEFDLMTVIKFLSWGLKDLIEQKNITFNMNVDDVANKLLTTNRVVGDKQRIVQTLGNFLSNAVKFTPSGGKLELDLQCEEVVDSKDATTAPNFTAYTPSDSSEGSLLGATGIQILTKTTSHAKLANQKVARLRLSVKDNGIGISAADQAKLFEPYSFVTSGWVLKAGVSGLGLSMAKRFVERAGGSIGVESVEGSGSTFFFSIPFPLVPVDLDSEREQSKVDPVAALLQKSEVTQSTSSSGVTVVHESITVSRRRSNMGSKEDLKPSSKTQPIQIPEDTPKETDGIQRKVLLVEDTRINRIILRKVLQNLNIQCDEAENGQVAVDFYKEGRTYDLVLMDKEMPVMDGHEATRQLRAMGVKTPIVALTGNALATDRQSFFEAGVDDFQTKPLSRDKLVQLLARYGVECSLSKGR